VQSIERGEVMAKWSADMMKFQIDDFCSRRLPGDDAEPAPPTTSREEIEWLDKEFHFSPMQSQVGGDHYSKMKIQPLEYSMANNLNACEHSVVKYVSRHRSKNGKQDLEKAIDMLQKLIAFEYE
jgi:hypothetical protein